MRVTFVLPNLNMSGGIRVAAIHADYLRRHGHDVRVLTLLHPPSSPWRIAKSVLRGRGWPPREVNGASHFDGLNIERLSLYYTKRPNLDLVPDADVVIAT